MADEGVYKTVLRVLKREGGLFNLNPAMTQKRVRKPASRMKPGAYEPKGHATYTICRVPSQSKFIAKYFPYKESKILLFETVYGLHVMTK